MQNKIAACSKFLLKFSSLKVIDVEIRKINPIKSESNFLMKIRFFFDTHVVKFILYNLFNQVKRLHECLQTCYSSLELDLYKHIGMLTY